jgi:hypothetical protein
VAATSAACEKRKAGERGGLDFAKIPTPVREHPVGGARAERKG